MIRKKNQKEKPAHNFGEKYAIIDIMRMSQNLIYRSNYAILLSGRYIQIEMLPFSFSEYLKFTSNSENLTKDESFRNFIFLIAYRKLNVIDWLLEGIL
jgi:predicted AAA+ superfamily ATPase